MTPASLHPFVALMCSQNGNNPPYSRPFSPYVAGELVRFATIREPPRVRAPAPDAGSELRARRRMNQADLIVTRIERARQDRSISVAELARRIDVGRKRLWYVLNGQHSMHVDEFVHLCVVIDV